jgi:hypothetical protein
VRLFPHTPRRTADTPRWRRAGVAIGAFFSLMNASFAYEDPLIRQQAAGGRVQRARDVAKEMGVNMWKSGRGFGKVGALFAGIECVIEGVGSHRLCARHFR